MPCCPKNESEYRGETEIRTDSPAADASGLLRPEASGGVYEEAARKAENFKSGAWTLLTVGIIGLVLVILLVLGLLPLRLAPEARVSVFVVMGTLFGVFIAMGINSFSSYKKQTKEAVRESALKEELTRYCRENLSCQKIDSACGIADGEEAETAYFKRTAEMKLLISENFLNLNEEYLDHFVDEMYDRIYRDE
ncbi:MAG: hypothetical protein Q4C65_02275 [Eubacteriales bacterium]|nr:hypothetical protein [Eubacteriales bacterium]